MPSISQGWELALQTFLDGQPSSTSEQLAAVSKYRSAILIARNQLEGSLAIAGLDDEREACLESAERFESDVESIAALLSQTSEVADAEPLLNALRRLSDDADARRQVAKVLADAIKQARR